MIEYNKQMYFDDRLFVLNLCRGKVERLADGKIETTIIHEDDTVDLIWCLATYRNCDNYPLFSLNHFETQSDALKYRNLIEPTVPLISLSGQSPQSPPAYADYLIWKRKSGFSDYDYKKANLHGGKNHRESVIQTEQQFLQSRQKVRTTLDETR